MRYNIIRAIVSERDVQEALKAEGKFRYTCADAGMGNSERLAVLAEEVGEVARAINYGDMGSLREELVHVASCCLAWLESGCNQKPA